ncbi:MAG: ATP-binding cassette domain-containing protein, partial [Burkholderiales bacterium]|nr:ATP-binding cassette domain-containing protein [Burkholderiales bacterium]
MCWRWLASALHSWSRRTSSTAARATMQRERGSIQGGQMSLVKALGLSKTYRAGDVEVQAVKSADFVIEPASFVAFVGPSGSGKSTLLNMIGCLDHPTSGTLTVLDTDISTLDRRASAHFRGRNIGFIFQDFNLVPVLTAYENIEYPLIMVQQ